MRHREWLVIIPGYDGASLLFTCASSIIDIYMHLDIFNVQLDD